MELENLRRRFGAAVLSALFALALGLPSNPVSAQQQQQPDTRKLDELFRLVLANPSDPEANFRYAEEAERLGLTRKAMAAYERVLMNNPGNQRARAGYERTHLGIEAAQTKFLLGMGFQYDSNVRLDDKNHKDDVASQFVLRVTDDRRLGTQPWRSSLEAYADVHASERAADFIYVNGQTGPVFVLGNGWQMQVAGGVEMALVKYDWLFWAPGVSAHFRTRGWDPLRNINISVSYADYASQSGNGSALGPGSNAFEGGNGRDGFIFGARMLFGWDNVIAARDNISIRPAFIYDNAKDSEFRFWAASLTFTYLAAIGSFDNGATQLFFSPELAITYRNYAGKEAFRTNDHKDTRWSPGAKLIATHDNLTAVLSYSYDRAYSSYDAVPVPNNLTSREYANHRVGINLYVDF